MDERQWRTYAEKVLSAHGFRASGLDFLGAGEQSRCYGTAEVAVLLRRTASVAQELMGHVLPGRGEISCNTYPALHWVTNRAADAGVRTPRICATGSDPCPYALMQRGPGLIAATHPDAQRCEVTWWGRLGDEIAKTNQVPTVGFGMFEPDGAGGYRGRYSGWADFLDRWLGAYLSVGKYAHNDTGVLDLFLAQRIVTEQDLELLVAKIRAAQRWPVTSVLTHYDNRLENVLIDAGDVTMLDWGLSLAGIGVKQELVKLGQTGPLSMDNPRVAAFLRSYGLTDAECTDALDGGNLLLALDGVAMSYGWAPVPERLAGIRAWLQAVKRVVAPT